MVIDMHKSRFQLRGHCQRCGHQQAVKNGTMAHHGYTVKDGWFQGTCSGHSFAPVEWSRATLDKTVEAIRSQCAALRAEAAKLSDTANWPQFVSVYSRDTRKDEQMALAGFSVTRQQEIIDRMIFGMTRRAEIGESTAQYLLDIADQFHGKDLIEVARDAGPEKIVPGEARVNQIGRTLYAEGLLHGGKVQYSFKQANGTEMFGRMSTRAWRALTKA